MISNEKGNWKRSREDHESTNSNGNANPSGNQIKIHTNHEFNRDIYKNTQTLLAFLNYARVDWFAPFLSPSFDFPSMLPHHPGHNPPNSTALHTCISFFLVVIETAVRNGKLFCRTMVSIYSKCLSLTDFHFGHQNLEPLLKACCKFHRYVTCDKSCPRWLAVLQIGRKMKK